MIARFGNLDAVAEIGPDVAAAARVLRAEQVAPLLEAIEGPLTPGKFFSNLIQAWRFTSLRIAPDPVEAERLLVSRSGDSG